jgi:hypothetical protein
MIKQKYLLYFCILSIFVSMILVAGCTQTQVQPQVQSDRSTWTIYADRSDGMAIGHPSNWAVITSKTTPMREIDLSSEVTMENVIHIYTPDGNGMIQVMGFSYPRQLQSEYGISDNAYNIITSALSKVQGSNKALTIVRDDNAYTLNGNPARKLHAVLLLNNKEVASNHYIIRHDKVYYIVSYVMYEPSAAQYSSTATEVIESFRTIDYN